MPPFALPRSPAPNAGARRIDRHRRGGPLRGSTLEDGDVGILRKKRASTAGRGPDHEDGYVSMVDHSIRNTAQQQPRCGGTTSRTHHDQVSVLEVRVGEDAFGRMVLQKFSSDVRDTTFLSRPHRAQENLVESCLLGRLCGFSRRPRGHHRSADRRGHQRAGRPHDGRLVNRDDAEPGRPGEGHIDGTVQCLTGLRRAIVRDQDMVERFAHLSRALYSSSRTKPRWNLTFTEVPLRTSRTPSGLPVLKPPGPMVPGRGRFHLHGIDRALSARMTAAKGMTSSRSRFCRGFHDPPGNGT